MSGSEANSGRSLRFGTVRSHRLNAQGQAHPRRHVRPPHPGRFGPVCSTVRPATAAPPARRAAQAARASEGPAGAESTIMWRRSAEHTGSARAAPAGKRKVLPIRGRDVEAPRLRYVRHSHSTMTHSAHHTHTSHSSRAPPALISDARCTRRHGTHKRQHSRATYGLWGSPSPPAAQSPTHEAHQPPNLSSSTASAAHATP